MVALSATLGAPNMKFPLLDCTVELRGALGTTLSTVRKSGIDSVTPAELMVLQQIHGADAITDIVETGDTEIDKAELLDRLVAKYGDVVMALFPQQALMPHTAPDGVERKIAKAPKVEAPEDDGKKTHRRMLAERYEEVFGSKPHNFWSAEKIQGELDKAPAVAA